MMLLTAFVLLIGFVALAGMVARVSQLADETGQESRRGAVLEAANVLDGAQAMFAQLETYVPPGTPDETRDYMDAADAALAHMDQLQSARGFQFRAGQVSCDDAGSPTTFTVDVSVVRNDVRVAATILHEISGVACPP